MGGHSINKEWCSKDSEQFIPYRFLNRVPAENEIGIRSKNTKENKSVLWEFRFIIAVK
jgi:hypothetical protein